MAIDVKLHKVVIVQNNDVAFGFTSIASAVSFIENQIIDEDKRLDFVKDALDGEADIDGNTYNILDVNSYLDIYEDEDEDETVNED